MYNALKKYTDSGMLPFHMPGHKYGRVIPEEIGRNLLKFDLTELSGLDNLHFPKGVIKRAQEEVAGAVGAEHTFFLVNGSTVGILAAIMTSVKPGEKIIIGRDCHRSAINAMILAKAVPVYVKPYIVNEFDIGGTVAATDIERAILDNADAKAVFITRPTYYGVCADIEKIVELAQKNGMILIVDEAHGAHLPYANFNVKSAVRVGADIVVQSAHKTLPAPTQTGYLHLNGKNVDYDLLRQNLSILQTTSPSYIFMFFLDFARSFMQQKGAELIENVVSDVGALRERIKGNTYIRVLEDTFLEEGSIEPMRLTINVSALGRTGYEFDKILRERYNILAEMSDRKNVVFITTVADTKNEIETLAFAIEAAAKDWMQSGDFSKTLFKFKDVSLPRLKIGLDEAYKAKFEWVELREASCRTCKNVITPYPPGVPIICPGEEFTEEIVELLLDMHSKGGNIDGLDNNLRVAVLK